MGAGHDDNGKNKKINEFIRKNKNEFTLNVYLFKGDLENFLGVKPVGGNEAYKKPLNVMWHCKNNKIKQEKIDELAKIVKDLINQ